MNRLTNDDRCRVLACPACGAPLNIGSLLGNIRSKRKAAASRANGKLGGWPKGKKRGPRKAATDFPK